MEDRGTFFKRFSDYIERVKKLLKEDVWQSSFWLKRKKKELESVVSSLEGAKQDLQNQVKNFGKETINKVKKAMQEIPEGTQEVFIQINQVNGRDMSGWERALKALPSCSFGRPVYTKESSARHAVSSMGLTEKSAYVSIYVEKEDILKQEQEYDSNGQEVIVLKPGAVKTSHIIKFVHYNQDVYLFVGEKLILDNDKASEASLLGERPGRGAEQDNTAVKTRASTEQPDTEQAAEGSTREEIQAGSTPESQASTQNDESENLAASDNGTDNIEEAPDQGTGQDNAAVGSQAGIEQPDAEEAEAGTAKGEAQADSAQEAQASTQSDGQKDTASDGTVSVDESPDQGLGQDNTVVESQAEADQPDTEQAAEGSTGEEIQAGSTPESQASTQNDESENLAASDNGTDNIEEAPDQGTGQDNAAVGSQA
ncbi:MAG: type IVB secretion system protein IcmQ, partial [Pseudomonadota bacterium]|nr:type IVB secretion system protein IcmQ [Pseudomonadota bacterium]